MNNLIIRKCKHHGETEFYSSPSAISCRACKLEKRAARRADPKKNARDKTYNKTWMTDNKDHLARLHKQRQAPLFEKIKVEKQRLFLEKVDNLKKIFKIYRPTKEFTDLELITMSLKISKSLTHSFTWDKFKDRMKNKIRQSIYMNEFIKNISKSGWIKMVNSKMQNTYKDAPESEKVRIRSLVLDTTSKKLKEITGTYYKAL